MTLRTGGASSADDDARVHVELRPPRSGLDTSTGMDAWIDINHAVRRLTADGRLVFLTDDAVGQSEEESLGHLSANLDPSVPRRALVPFLTCKHSLEYCLLYAERAQAMGIDSLTVVGGDPHMGPERCVPHAYLLRRKIRDRVPGLRLGGWANPFREADEQAGYVCDPEFDADFLLTQIVSHHSAQRLEDLLSRIRLRGHRLPVLAGIFHYRSSNPRTLERLAGYFPVPAARIREDFERGLGPTALTGMSIRAALDAGADGVYLSNLGLRGAHRTLTEILDHAGL